MSGLLTTSVGSFPKPPELQAARNKMLRGELGRDELEQMERDATAFWIKSWLTHTITSPSMFD